MFEMLKVWEGKSEAHVEVADEMETLGHHVHWLRTKSSWSGVHPFEEIIVKVQSHNRNLPLLMWVVNLLSLEFKSDVFLVEWKKVLEVDLALDLVRGTHIRLGR